MKIFAGNYEELLLLQCFVGKIIFISKDFMYEGYFLKVLSGNKFDSKTIEPAVKFGVRAVIQFFIQKKRRGMLSSGIVLLHDNARPHTAAATKGRLKRFLWEVFDHPPSSTRAWLPVIFISFLV